MAGCVQACNSFLWPDWFCIGADANKPRAAKLASASLQIEEGFRETKSTHVGLDFTSESQIEAERRANLLLIAALIIFALWLIGICLNGTDIERQIKVNNGRHRSPESPVAMSPLNCLPQCWSRHKLF
jgi:hypothetical protein